MLLSIQPWMDNSIKLHIFGCEFYISFLPFVSRYIGLVKAFAGGYENLIDSWLCWVLGSHFFVRQLPVLGAVSGTIAIQSWLCWV